jgi:predicted RNA binding protein YcfA (HicA-like mRNA interferase family)
MPRKVRQLIRDLEKAGFIAREGKGSHRNFTHPKSHATITISGRLSDDAKQMQSDVQKIADRYEHIVYWSDEDHKRAMFGVPHAVIRKFSGF